MPVSLLRNTLSFEEKSEITADAAVVEAEDAVGAKAAEGKTRE